MFKKIKRFIKRKLNAIPFRIPFTRSSKWKTPTAIKINGKTIYLNTLNDGATNSSFIDIFMDDVYGLKYFNKVLRGKINIIDIGANQGLFTLAVNHFFNAEVHAYEPNQLIYERLAFHCKQVNAKYFQEAVGLKNQFVALTSAADTLHSETYNDEQGSIKQISIHSAINAFNNNVHLLKLDCEGAEWEILKDAASLKFVKAITMEYHLKNDYNHDTINIVLGKLQFKIVHKELSGPTWGIVWALNNN